MKDKLDIKKLIGNLILLFVIIGFVSGYSSVFGEANSLIGVTVITAALMFLNIDLGYKLGDSVVTTLVLFTLVGVITSVSSSTNLAIGFIINMLFIFVMMYITSKEIYTKAYLPFILLFVFLDGNPVSSDAYLTRIIGCFIGASIMSIVMYFSNKSKATNEDRVVDLVYDTIDFSSERFRFSIKMAVGVSIATLLGNVMGVEKFMWITVSVMSIIQPNIDDSKIRIRQRFLSTIIGFIAFVILFDILNLESYLPILTLIIGYIYTFIQTYEKKMIFVALNALISCMGVYDTYLSIWYRVGFLIMGIGISYIVSIVIDKIFEKLN